MNWIRILNDRVNDARMLNYWIFTTFEWFFDIKQAQNNVRISDESYFDFSIFWWCDKCAQIIDSDDGTVIC